MISCMQSRRCRCRLFLGSIFLMSGQYFVAFQHGDVCFYCSLWLICSLWVLHGMTLKVYVGFSLASLLCVFEICGSISFNLVTVVIGFPLFNCSWYFFISVSFFSLVPLFWHYQWPWMEHGYSDWCVLHVCVSHVCESSVNWLVQLAVCQCRSWYLIVSYFAICTVKIYSVLPAGSPVSCRVLFSVVIRFSFWCFAPVKRLAR